ncbi:MAG: glycosyltransferase [Candidatus Bathyarchaeia archaeon]
MKKVADRGVKIKAFGSKMHYVPAYILRHPNIEILGKLTNEELVELYSNALYTLFTFTHEPFGYVPTESMACGTPVLTYNRQGPCETVINGQTGWVANSDEELVKVACEIWRKGYPQITRSKCRQRALEFDLKKIAKQWLKFLEELDT